VRLFVLRVGGAPVSFHALLFKLEMGVGVGFQKINQVEQELAFRPGGIGFGQHPLKMINIVDQHPVLLIQLAGASREAFIPKDHGKILICLLPRSGLWRLTPVQVVNIPAQIIKYVQFRQVWRLDYGFFGKRLS